MLGESTLSHDTNIPPADTDYTTLTAVATAEAAGGHERRPINYGELAAGDVDVLLLGENHYHTALFEDIGRSAPDLYNAGVRAFFLEARDDQDFSALNSGDFRGLDSGELNIGPTLQLFNTSKRFERLGDTDPIADAKKKMIKALVNQGIPIVPIDSSRYWDERIARTEALKAGQTPPVPTVTSQEREAEIADNIDAVVARYGKVAGLMGQAHTRKGTIIDARGETQRKTGQSAIDHGHRVRTVHFHGADFFDGDARRPLSYLTADGWGNQAYMYQPQDGDPLAGDAKGSPDWIAYIPPAPFELEYAPAMLNSESRTYPLLQPSEISNEATPSTSRTVPRSPSWH